MIILASNSERRRDILSKFINFKIEASKHKEDMTYFNRPSDLVMGLSFEKGIDVANNNPSDIVISADTIVFHRGEVLGKPKDREDAKRMIQLLSADTHRVLTGYSIFNIEKSIKYSDYEVSYVKFKNLSEDTIENYLNTLEYEGKAGSYAIQGKGSLLIESINGDFHNIVGLPISKISDDLLKLFNISLMRGD